MRATSASGSVLSRVMAAKIVAVATVETPAQGAAVARALVRGGVTVLELALRTPLSLDAISVARRAEPTLLLGAGTVLTNAQADAARANGADFALAPGLDEATVRHCQRVELPFIPGVSSPSEIQAALRCGCHFLKWFPAEFLGGVEGLRAAAAPFQACNLKFIPLGGIGLETMRGYLNEPLVAAVGGSWIVPSQAVREENWELITLKAAEAVAMISQPPANIPS